MSVAIKRAVSVILTVALSVILISNSMLLSVKAEIGKISSGGNYDIKIDQYISDYDRSKEVKVTVSMKSDAEFQGNIEGWSGGAYKRNEFISNSGEATVVWIGAADYAGITVALSEGNEVNIEAVTVIYADESESEVPVETTTKEAGKVVATVAAKGDFNFNLSDYCPNYDVTKEAEITVKMKGNGWFNGGIGGNVQVDGENAWKTEGFEGNDEVTATVRFIATYGALTIQNWSDNSFDIVSLTVKQDGEEITTGQSTDPNDYLHIFTEAWAGFDNTQMGDYFPAFEGGKQTTITIVLDKEVSVQLGYHNPNWATETKTGREVTFDVIPSDGYLNIQVTDMSGNSEIKILSIKVEQKIEETTTQETIKNEVTIDGIKVEVVDNQVTLGNAQYGYFCDGKMYAPNTVVDVTANMAFTAVKELSVTMANGAGIRYQGTAGIRFQSTITSDNIAAVESAAITEGTLITANDIYEAKGTPLTLTSDYTKINVVNSGWYQQEDDTRTYCGSICNVIESNYIRNFIARAYVTINYENADALTIYSDMGPVRNISQIATMVKNAGYPNIPEESKSIIDSFIK